MIQAFRHNATNVTVQASAGHFLRYTVSFSGNVPGMRVKDVDANEVLLSSSMHPPAGPWTRDWPTAADQALDETSHVADFVYAGGATGYTYQVSLHAGGSTFPLVDIDYVPANPTDFDFHNLAVRKL